MADRPRLPEHVLRDLGAKLAEDIGERIRLSTALSFGSPQDAFFLALAATAVAAGSASAFAKLCAPDADVEEVVDSLWMVLRPIVVAGAGGGIQDFRALLRAAPKGRSNG